MGMVLGKRYAILLDTSVVDFPVIQVLLLEHNIMCSFQRDYYSLVTESDCLNF